MPQLVVFIPALIRNRDDMEMVRVQSLLRDRFRLACSHSNVRITSCVVFDDVSPGFLTEAKSLDFCQKIFLNDSHPDARRPTGIRRPTEFFLRQVSSLYDASEELFLLRVIQDAMVIDAMRLTAELLDILQNQDSRFLAGQLAQCADIGPCMDRLSIPRQSRYEYVQGAMMFANSLVWQTHYLALPSEITHLRDDSVMSQMVVAAGGRLVPMSQSWVHRHGCPFKLSMETYALHASELGRRSAVPLQTAASATSENGVEQFQRASRRIHPGLIRGEYRQQP